MKKYGKKWRKLEAEKKIERERMQAKAGEPFSRIRKKKILCTHYVKMQSLGCLPSHGWYSSLLEPISTEECMCSTCKKRFPIAKCAQMEELLKHLSNSEQILGEECFERYSKLSQGLEPVYYRRLSETEIEILETVEISEVGCRLRVPLISMRSFTKKDYVDVFICKRYIPPDLARNQVNGEPFFEMAGRIPGEIRVDSNGKHTLIVAVGADENTGIAHFHVYRSQNDLEAWSNGACLMFTEGRYFSHEKNYETLSHDELGAVVAKLKEKPSKNLPGKTNWEYLIFLWNAGNYVSHIPLATPMPTYDYNTIMRYTERVLIREP